MAGTMLSQAMGINSSTAMRDTKTHWLGHSRHRNASLVHRGESRSGDSQR